MKNKFNPQLSANADDIKSGKLADLQKRLDEIQSNGMTAMTIRDVLFQKMLDVYQVPNDHALRESETPERIDDPSIIKRLIELGFQKKPQYQVH